MTAKIDSSKNDEGVSQRVWYWYLRRNGEEQLGQRDEREWMDGIDGLEIERGECSKEVLHRYEEEFNIDCWYDHFKHLTFPSVFLPISQSEAVVLLTRYCDLVLYSHIPSDVQELLDCGIIPLDTRPEGVLSALKSRIDRAMASIPNPHTDIQTFFVRMSARSPKDSAYGTETMKSLLTTELRSSQEEGTAHGNMIMPQLSPRWIQNIEFAAFFRAQIASLRVDNADTALDLLMRSERIYEDLKIALTERHLRWDQKMAIRQWCTELDIAGEFRCFVYQKQLTAISQYFHFICFPDLIRCKEEIEKAIRQFFKDQVLPILKWDNCIMDVLVCFPRRLHAHPKTVFSIHHAELTLRIVEFNPFTRYTSSCLFAWFDPHDFKVIHGKLPAEFRLLEKPLDHLVDQKSNAQNFFSLQSQIDPSILQECSSVLALVQEHLQDDLSRINSSLRYVVRHNQLETAMAAYRKRAP